jgi:hypothetical protein
LIFVVRLKCTKDKGAELTTVFSITESIEVKFTLGSYNRVAIVTTVNQSKLSGWRAQRQVSKHMQSNVMVEFVLPRAVLNT